jgi:hypothetical protein
MSDWVASRPLATGASLDCATPVICSCSAEIERADVNGPQIELLNAMQSCMTSAYP